MKSFNMRRLCAFVCAIACSCALFADLDSEQLVAQSRRAKARGKVNNEPITDSKSWKPYYLKLKVVEPNKMAFVEENVGVGFLYFRTIRGNLQGTNVAGSIKSNSKFQGHVGYNRTPITELVIGRDFFFNWLKIALAYQHQGGVMIQLQPQLLVGAVTPADLNAHLRLDTVQFRAYLMLPWVLVWKGAYYEPYLSAAVGPGWQTWGDIFSNALSGTNYRLKVSANCVYTIDLGFKIRQAIQSYIMAFTIGCKYTGWGQARSIGKLSQQYKTAFVPGTRNVPAFFNPPRIQTVYQFAPYIGVQLNF